MTNPNTTRMMDLTTVTDSYLETLLAAYHGMAVPPDLAAEVERRKAGQQAQTQAKAVARTVALAGFWIEEDLGAAAQGYQLGYAKMARTIDVDVLAIGRYLGLSAAQLIAALQPLDLVWRAKRSGKAKKRWLEWKDGRPSRVQFHDDVLKEYLNANLTWTPKMGIGTGTTVHLHPDEVPADCLARISQAIVVVQGGHVYAPYNPVREGTRAVYGWWTK